MIDTMEITARKSAFDRAVSGILDIIVQSGVESGDKLPSERELSELLQVGRPSVREALSALSMLNIVDIKQFDGLYVSSMNPKRMMIPYKLYMNMGKFDINHLFEARTVLETALIDIAATKLTEDQIAQIENIVDTEDVENEYSFAQTDEMLHNIIYDATDNFLLKTIMTMINSLSSASRKTTGQFREVREMVHKDHVKILSALKQRNSELSKEAMGQHIMNLYKIYQINSEIYKEQFLQRLREEIDND